MAYGRLRKRQLLSGFGNIFVAIKRGGDFEEVEINGIVMHKADSLYRSHVRMQ
jgi:hypothetical protein